MHLRDLLPKQPRFHDRWWIDLHIPTLVLFYSVWIVGLLTIGRYVMQHGFVITMENIEYIPGDYIVPVAVALVVTAVLMYAIFYLVAFQNKKSQTLSEQAKAVNEGKPVDELALARIKNFHIVYKVAMILGIIITSAIAFALMAVIVGKYVDFTMMKAVVYAVGTEIAVYLVFDRFAGRPIADGTFKSKVIDPVTEGIVSQFLGGTEAPADEKAVKEEDPVEQIATLLAQVLKK